MGDPVRPARVRRPPRSRPGTARDTGRVRRSYLAGYDVLVVLVFAGVGRASHDEGLTLTGWAHTAWPFLVGLAVGWAVALRAGRGPDRVPGSLLITVVGVAVAMVLRVVTGAGTAVAFVIVALVFLGLFTVGARLVVPLLARRRRRAGASR